MEKKINIAYLDDEPANLKLVQQALGGEYNVCCFSSPGEFLALDDLRFDILLLDVNMPNINGYEVCEALRSKDFEKPIVFISALDDMKDRLRGYEAGGSGYVTKPFNINELKLIIKNNLKQDSLLQTTKDKLQQAHSTAITAITNTSEIGIALNFIQQAYASSQPDSLSENLRVALHAYNLKAVFSFRAREEGHHYSSENKLLTELEKELLGAYERCNKISTHANSCLLSSRNVSILVKNMPSDPGKTGRLRDHLAQIHDSAQHQLDFINTKYQQEVQQEVFISSLHKHMQELIVDIDGSTSLSRKRANDVVEDIKRELFDLELKQDLSDESSRELRSISSQLQSSLDMIFDEFDHIEQQVNLLIEGISNYSASL